MNKPHRPVAPASRRHDAQAGETPALPLARLLCPTLLPGLGLAWVLAEANRQVAGQ